MIRIELVKFGYFSSNGRWFGLEFVVVLSLEEYWNEVSELSMRLDSIRSSNGVKTAKPWIRGLNCNFCSFRDQIAISGNCSEADSEAF